MKFTDMPLSRPIQQAIAQAGYEIATPIQAQAIPLILDGRAVLGCAQTGTGKTAAFALPMLDRLARPTAQKPKGPRRARGLVIAPTRELAEQIAESFKTYGKYTDLFGTVIFGGVGQGSQVNALRKGVDIIVATPGRLLDLINQRYCDLSKVEIFVLDEADRMLDMGFMPDIKRIISHLPQKKQTLLFSATMPGEIRMLASTLMHDPAEVTITPKQPAVERIAQSVIHVNKPDKTRLLIQLMQEVSISRAIVFTRTKHGADRVVRQLKQAGTDADAIHGDKSQNARRRALDRFRNGDLHVLVATDIAARGIDVDGISHVINYDMARDPESHVHRIGRTARAGADGAAISFCDPEEIEHLRAIERLMRKPIPVNTDRPSLPPAPQSHNPHSPSHQPGRPRAQQGPRKSNSRSGRPAYQGQRSGPSAGPGKNNRTRRPHRGKRSPQA